MITTEECLLSPGRNPELSREQIEEHLRDYLNVEKVVWLAKGIDPEETNGHVDDVACFVRPGVVLAAVTDDKDDWRYELLQDNLRRLREATDARGRRLEVHTVPMPAIMEITEDEAWGIDSAEGSHPRQPGDKTAASYLNFLICNGGIVMPQLRRPERRRRQGDARGRSSPIARSSPSPGARSCSAAATCTASPSSNRQADRREFSSRDRAALRPARAPCPTAHSRSRPGSRGRRRTRATPRCRRGPAASP